MKKADQEAREKEPAAAWCLKEIFPEEIKTYVMTLKEIPRQIREERNVWWKVCANAQRFQREKMATRDSLWFASLDVWGGRGEFCTGIYSTIIYWIIYLKDIWLSPP